jgi:hypothetical protein
VGIAFTDLTVSSLRSGIDVMLMLRRRNILRHPSYRQFLCVAIPLKQHSAPNGDRVPKLLTQSFSRIRELPSDQGRGISPKENVFIS